MWAFHILYSLLLLCEINILTMSESDSNISTDMKYWMATALTLVTTKVMQAAIFNN